MFEEDRMERTRISFMRSIGGKIALVFVLVVLLSIGVVTVLSVRQSSTALTDSRFSQLEAIRQIKQGQIATYFADRRGDMNVLSETVMALQQSAFKELQAVHSNKLDAVKTYFETFSPQRSDISPGSSFDRAMSRIFDNRDGLGETGESYLVEEIGGRYLFRSDMETMGGGAFVFGYDATDIAPEYLIAALSGEAGEEVFTDSAGKLVMVVYSPVEVDGFNFAMVTKMDLEEAIVPTIAGRVDDYFTDYIAEYGYYDLFLINESGMVFYTVAKEADYNTNIISGKYSDSSLGEAVREAVSTKEFAFGDFQPYEPSNGAPAAFIAQPILHDGAIELIVALQMPLDQINAIMQERTGMGETGESYLVGPEKLMRSDSYLDPENHSVEASFARPETGDVDTEASRNALAGESGAKVVIDYNGNPVLSAFAPVEVYDTTWALMSEIDEAEVRQPINTLTTFILISALVVIAIAIAAAVLFSRTISKPILLLVAGARNLAVGDIQLSSVNREEFDAVKNRTDELGVIGDSFNDVIEYQTEKTKLAEKIASGNLQVEASISSDQDTLGKAFKTMVESLNDILGQVRVAIEQVAAGAGQVSSASQELSQGATESASSVEEITSSINQISSQSRETTDNAAEANSLSQQAATDAQGGQQQMNELQSAMESISNASDEITKVVKVIDDIAFQINLLALNANVEAARAGKYGKGFAVVAEEVRNLAVRSAEAVKETTAMVDQSVSSIETGNELTGKTASQLESIVSGAERVSQFLQELAASSKEQSQAIDQITEGLGQVDQVTQSNTASAEESASAAEELSSQAEQLRSAIATFKLKASTDAEANRLQAPASRSKTSHTGGQERTEKAAVAASNEPDDGDRSDRTIELDDDGFDRF
jgi:methyl-accepting chemotaxis protein